MSRRADKRYDFVIFFFSIKRLEPTLLDSREERNSSAHPFKIQTYERLSGSIAAARKETSRFTRRRQKARDIASFTGRLRSRRRRRNAPGRSPEIDRKRIFRRRRENTENRVERCRMPRRTADQFPVCDAAPRPPSSPRLSYVFIVSVAVSSFGYNRAFDRFDSIAFDGPP